MSGAPGWYPDPRPGHSQLQAYWDGTQWQLGATRLSTGAEVTWWIVGIAAALLLSTVFPPALIFAVAIGLWWYSVDQQKKKQARAQAEWQQRQGPL
jgi:chromate transport protein ChrA